VIVRIVDLRPCAKCGGVVTPVSMCAKCGAVSVRSDLAVVESQIECAECKASSPTVLVCDRCSTRYPFDEVIGAAESRGACPNCGTFLEAGEKVCPTCGTALQGLPPEAVTAKAQRSSRRVRGDYSKEDLTEISRIPGVDERRAETLCRAGYNALWKVKRVAESELAAIKEIGPQAAKMIKDSVRFMLLLPRRRPKEEILEEERECPLCHCVTSLFVKKCHDCGAVFDEEELDLDVRTEVEREPDRALLAFYDVRLREDESDPDLWYARALLLLSMGQRPEALESIDTALRLSDGAKRVLLARSRILSGMHDQKRAAAELKEVKEMTSPPTPVLRQEPEIPVATEGELHEAVEAFDSLLGLKERECPLCGQPILPDAQVCPVCGTSLANVPASPRPRGEVEAVEAFDPAPQRGKLTKTPASVSTHPGASRVSSDRYERRGLINGHGLVNGKGRVNGLINGNGFVNGSAVTTYRLPGRATGARYAIVAVSLLMAFILAAVLFVPPSGPVSAVIVDGNPAEWASLPTYVDPVPSPNPDAAIERYGVFSDGIRLYALVQVAGRALGDSAGYDAFYLFFDTDGDSTSGYQIEGLGVDDVVEVYGGEGRVVSARLYEFPPDAEINWSRRTVAAPVSAAVFGSALELAVDIDAFEFSATDSVILVATDDFDGVVSRASLAITGTYGAIRIRQRPLVSVIPTGTGAALELEVTAMGTIPDGDTWPVGPFSFVATAGVTAAASPATLTLSRANPSTTVIVFVTATAFSVGTPLEVAVSSVSADRPVTISGEGLRAYFEAVPPGIRVDGLFEDWASLRFRDTDVSASPRPSLDIESFGGTSNASGTYFHLQVAGSLHGGIPIPQRIAPAVSAPGGGGPSPPGPPLPRVTGEDIAQVYIDVNSSDSVGVSVGGIFADYMVEVRGIGGRITSQTPFRWQPGWVPDSSLTLRTAKNATALEGSLGLSPAALNATEMVFATTDWSGVGDSTIVLATRGYHPSMTRGGPRFTVMGDSSGLQVIHASPLLSTPILDGVCTDPEYADAGILTQSNLTMRAGRRDSFVWICIEASADTTNDSSVDSAYLHFDRDDSGAPLSKSDRRFRLDATTSALIAEIGNASGTGWVSCAVNDTPAWDECDSGNGGTGTFGTAERYEFKIHYHDVWNASSLSGDEIAGFAVLVYDASIGETYRWGNTDVAVNTLDPDTWGQVALPEFREIVVPVASVVLILLFLRRRRRTS